MTFVRRPLRWSLVALAALLVLGVAGSPVPASATSGVRAGAAAPAAGDHRDVLSHGVDTVRPHARVAGRSSVAWRGRTIRYHESLPARWDWSLRTAVRSWNGSGSGISFVRVADRSRAQVTISFGDISPAAGLATVGRVPGAFVELSDVYRNADADSAHDRVEVMGILAHELGHVLGFEHTTTPCDLMGPVLDVVGCGNVADARPGDYRCRTIEAALVTRLVRMYGGRARLAPTGWCLIDPLPPVLTGVDIDLDPQDGRARARWSRPAAVGDGVRVQVAHWAGDCGAEPPADAVRETASATALAWEEPVASGDPCVTVALVNRYGRSRSLSSARLAPPQPVSVASPTPGSDPWG